MNYLTSGYSVDDFKVYAEFWTAKNAIDSFITSEYAHFSNGSNQFEVHHTDELIGRELWLIVNQGDNSTWGQFELAPDGSQSRLRAMSILYDPPVDCVHWYVTELKRHLAKLGLLYPPKPTNQQQAQPAETSAALVKPDRTAPQPDAIRSVLEASKKTQPLGLVLFKAARDIVACSDGMGNMPSVASLTPAEQVSRIIIGYAMSLMTKEVFRKEDFEKGLYDFILPMFAENFLRQFPTLEAAVKKFNKPINMSGISSDTLATVDQLLNLTVEEARMLVFAKPLVMQFKESLLSQSAQPPKTSAGNGRQTKGGGRPRNADDDWAWEQVNIKNRPQTNVYQEWLLRIGTRADTLADPFDSFKKAIKKGRGKKGT